MTIINYMDEIARKISLTTVQIHCAIFPVVILFSLNFTLIHATLTVTKTSGYHSISSSSVILVYVCHADTQLIREDLLPLKKVPNDKGAQKAYY